MIFPGRKPLTKNKSLSLLVMTSSRFEQSSVFFRDWTDVDLNRKSNKYFQCDGFGMTFPIRRNLVKRRSQAQQNHLGNRTFRTDELFLEREICMKRENFK